MRTMLIVMCVALAGCKKGPTEPVVTDGWIQGWAGACYYPKDWEALGPGDRRLARQATLEAMMEQWSGKRGDGVSFDDTVVENVETALLGRPEKIESVSQENAAKCATAMASADNGPWSSWLDTQPAILNKGECDYPLVDTWFNYLDIARDWQNKAKVCKGNVVNVSGAEIDYYRITEKGPWINVAGDTSIKTAGKENYPCNTEGCYAGMLLMRFTGESGIVQIHPVGVRMTFTAPENGAIDVMINDDTYFDNKYKIESGLEHHTSITYAPGSG